MRDLSVIYFLIVMLLYITNAPATQAQEDVLEKKIDINVKDIPLSELLDMLETRYGIRFSYSDDNIDSREVVSIRLKNKSLSVLLDQVFTKRGISYSIVGGQVVLKAAGKDTREERKKETIPQYTISGYLQDKESGEAIIGATVAIPELMKGTMTNPYGFYSLTVPGGSYTLQYSYVGYQTMSEPVQLQANKKLDITLEAGDESIEEVRIEYREKEDPLAVVQTGTFKMHPSELNTMPGMMGQPDLIKSLSLMPGITPFGDGSTSFFVRGGNRDQNLILIDEAPVFNPSHLLGIVSTFVPDALNDIRIYKGDIPASFGGRLSSLIDINTKEGNMKETSVSGSLGLMNSHVAVDGPLWKDNNSYFLSLRRSNLNWLVAQSNPDNNIQYHDLNMKVNTRVGKKDRLFLSMYSGRDIFSTHGGNLNQKGGITWTNSAITLRWNHVYNEKLFSTTSLYNSQYDYRLYVPNPFIRYWNSLINHTGLKSNFTYYANTSNTVQFGAELGGYYFNPGNLNMEESYYYQFIPRVSTVNSSSMALFWMKDTKVSPVFSVRYGLRLSTWSSKGPATVYSFAEDGYAEDTLTFDKDETIKSYASLEPRISLSLMTGKSTAVKFSYGKTTQHIHLISNSLSPFTSLEVWLPSGYTIRPGIANQVTLGIQHFSEKRKIESSAEVFYKKMKHQLEYTNHALTLLNPELEGQLKDANAKSMGLELLMKKSKGNLSGWITYTLSRTMMHSDDINDGNPYPAFYDRPHVFGIVGCYNVRKRWQLSANWIYSSGAAFTSPTSFYYHGNILVPVYSEKNNDRLPPYHRLDFSTRLNLNPASVKMFRHSIVFTIFNLYGRLNPVAVNFNKTLDVNGKLVVPVNYSTRPFYTASELAVFGVIPSISYFFEF